jgi:hypothetical protein
MDYSKGRVQTKKPLQMLPHIFLNGPNFGTCCPVDRNNVLAVLTEHNVHALLHLEICASNAAL